MQFSPKTTTLLKSFSTINPSIQFKKGNVLRTFSPTKTMFAIAKLEHDIDDDFCIHDLTRFLSSMSLFSQPNISLTKDKKQLKIKGDKSEIVYTCAEPKTLKLPPDGDIVLPSIDCEFSLSNENLQTLFKAMTILGLPEVAVIGKDGKLTLEAISTDNSMSDGYSLTIGETDKTFKIIFKTENLKLMPMSYNVAICRATSEKGVSIISRWTGSENSLIYFIAVDRNSEF